jgi:hypothetical protein
MRETARGKQLFPKWDRLLKGARAMSETKSDNQKSDLATPDDGTTSRGLNQSGGVSASLGGDANGLPRDLISLEEVDVPAGMDVPGSRTKGGGKGDTLMQAAEAFEQQLQQMSSWKHQLASQMELLRRDGIKMLERQKNLALERRKLQQEREEVIKEKGEAQALYDTLDIERKKLDVKAAELEKASEGLLELQTQKEKWLGDLNAAREQAEKATAKRAAVEAEIGALESKVAEYRRLEGERDTLLKQIHEARSTLADLAKAQGEITAQRQELEAKSNEVRALAQQIAEREKTITGLEAEVRKAAETLEAQRQALEAGQNKLAGDQQILAQQIDEHAKWLDEARRQIETEQVSGKQMVAAANERLAELSEAQKNFEIQKQELANRAISLEGQELQLAKREKDVAEIVAKVKSQEEAIRAAQEEIAAHQSKLAAAENTLAGHRAKIEAELSERQAKMDAAEADLAARHEEHLAQKSAVHASLDEREASVAEQLEHLAKQTKRLNEKRAQIEAEAARLDATLANRIKAATEQARADAESAKANAAAQVEEYKGKIAALEQQVRDFGALGAQQNTQHSETVRALAAAEARVAELSADIESYKGAADKLAAAQQKLQTVEAALTEAANGQAELEAEFGKVLENHKFELAEMQNQIRQEYEAKLAAVVNAAPAPAPVEGGASAAELKQAREAARTFEMQRDELGAELIAAQEALAKARDEANQTRISVEGELTHLRVRCEKLENANIALEKKLKAAPKSGGPQSNQPDNPRNGMQRARLLQQARNLRAYRKQQREFVVSLEKTREETARQREQLQSRKENLEQVKRLLEKQEMVMARKLADHSAIKTVAAVVFSVFMILGGTFLAVYKFVSPVYGSEALVQVNPPANIAGKETAAWLGQQGATIRSTPVAHEAWKLLRSDAYNYNGHAGRDEWIASLPSDLTIKTSGAHSISIQYEAATPESAAKVCNALANAYAAQLNADTAAGHATVTEPIVKAFGKETPIKDTRFMTALTATAAILVVCLIAVMLGRYYIRRQLREIDRMADDAELEDIKGEMAT